MRRHAIRLCTGYLGFTLLLMAPPASALEQGAMSPAATGAMAQNAQPNAPSAASSAARPGEARGPLPAPVGHRQPKPSDLPQDIGKRENQPDQSWRDLDDKLRICKGC